MDLRKDICRRVARPIRRRKGGQTLRVFISHDAIPEHFDLFLPALETRAASVEKTIWHLDGPGELPHLDKILSLPWVHAVQALPGAGIPDPLQWMEVYKKIQAAGKSLYIANMVSLDQARVLARELKPEGLMIPVSVRSKRDADEFLKELKNM